MKRPIPLLCALLLLSACGGDDRSTRGGDPPPPIILIALDTLRADHLPTYGYARATGPALDRLAADSVVFTNAASQASQTLISFKSLFSGAHPLRLLESQGLEPETLARVAPEDATAVLTKAFRAVRPRDLLDALGRRGLPRVAFADGGWVTRSSGFHEGFDRFDSRREGLEGRLPRVRSFLAAAGDRPFFLFVHAYDVHCPYATREPYQSAWHDEHAGHEILMNECFKRMRDEREIRDEDIPVLTDHYDGGIASADEWLGGFLSEIRETGLYDRALIVFLSDHGEALGERRVGGELMIGHGGLHPEQLHVPLFFKLPASAGVAPRRIDAYVELVDVMPTLIDFVGGEVPEGIDGRSLLPLIRGEAETHRESLTAQLTYEALPTRETRLGAASSWIPGRRFVLRDEIAGSEATYDLVVDPLGARPILSTFEGLAARSPDGIEETRRSAGETLEIPDDERERLRALGYLE